MGEKHGYGWVSNGRVTYDVGAPGLEEGMR